MKKIKLNSIEIKTVHNLGAHFFDVLYGHNKMLDIMS